MDAILEVMDACGHYSPASAPQILEAARKIVDEKMRRGDSCTSPEGVGAFLCIKLGGLDHEVFSVLFLDTRHRLIEYVEMFRGTLTQTSVYPREVVKEALRLNAGAVILAHNHPSGGLDPSDADKAITMTLKNALAAVDVRVLDHVIVGGNKSASFLAMGLL